MTPEDISEHHDFMAKQNVDVSYPPDKIKVIGVGGGGGNAVTHMYNLGKRNVTFIIANTDRQALNNSPVPTKVLLGPNTLRGRGAGNDPEKARKAAEESAETISELLDDETDMVFITAGMGGGTGTGASPVIAKIAKEKGLLTIGIVTIPFLFEGKKKILKALEGANKMRDFVDALMVISNERISEIYSNLDFLSAFGKADDVLTDAAMSISEIVTTNGFINLDFNDVDRTLREGGTAIISTGYGEGENRVSKAIQDALHSPLLRNKDIMGSRKLLFNLYFSNNSTDKFRIEETKQITEFIATIDHDVDVIWGVACDDSLGEKVKFTILAAGFDVTVDEETKISFPETGDSKEEKQTDAQEASATSALRGAYGQSYEGFIQTRNQRRYIILQPDQLDDDHSIEVLTNNPAYNRKEAIVDALKRHKPSASKGAAETAQPAPTPTPTSKNDTSSSTNIIEFNDL